MAILVYFLEVLLIFTTHINCQKDSVEKLKLAMSSELATHERKFVLSFQGINPAQLLCPKNSYQWYMTFSSKYSTKVNETFGRFAQLQSIVCTNFSVKHKYIHNTFHDFALRPKYVFILIVDCREADKSCKKLIIPMYINQCPALKIFVLPRSHTKTNALIGAFLTAGYFKHKRVPISDILNLGLLATPLHFPRNTFGTTI